MQTGTTTRVFNCAAGTEEAYDPTGQTCYMKSCEMFQVLPASYFLRHMQKKELSVMHHGLGPQVISWQVRDCMKTHQVTIFTEGALPLTTCSTQNSKDVCGY